MWNNLELSFTIPKNVAQLKDWWNVARERITGEALCSPENCHAQCWEHSWFSTWVCSQFYDNCIKLKAPYFHCSSHDLNLVKALSKASSLPEI